MLDHLFSFKHTNKIGRFCWLDEKYNNNFQLWCNTPISKKELIGSISNIAVYFTTYDGWLVLGRRFLSLGIVKKGDFICHKAEGNTCRYFKAVKKGVDPAFYAKVIIQYVSIKIVYFWDISFYCGVIKTSYNISFNKGNVAKDNKTLKMLYKEHHIFVVYIILY